MRRFPLYLSVVLVLTQFLNSSTPVSAQSEPGTLATAGRSETWIHHFTLTSRGFAMQVGRTTAPPPSLQPIATVSNRQNRPLRIIAFGAHPDDAEIKAGGVGTLWAAQGHHVKFVSVTNGDIGHWRMAGGPLAIRRKIEVEKADKLLGVTSEILDIHDGELVPSLEYRRIITRRIRQWKADIVLAHRPNDYHPDHRYTGVLVQDAAFMVTVPFFCPDTPALQNNPVFLYYSDRFQKPNPFEPDIVVSLDSVIDKKVTALAIMESQFLEGGANGSAKLLPNNEQERIAGLARVRDRFARRFANIANQYRDKLIELYGKEKGREVKYAEAFEVCEYGRQPTMKELVRMFPIETGE